MIKEVEGRPFFPLTIILVLHDPMWSRLHLAIDRLKQRVSPKRAFDRAREGIKEAAAITSQKASETAYNTAQRARDTVTDASKRTSQAAKEYVAITSAAAKEYASTTVDAAKESTLMAAESAKQSTLQSMESAKQLALDSVESAKLSTFQAVESVKPSFRWLWWWSLAAVGVYGLAVSIPREIRVAIENRRNETKRHESDK